MAKIKKYLSSFKNTLLFSFLPVLAHSNFYSEDAPDVWDYAIAPVLPLIFIYILVTDIIAYRKANKELEEEWLKHHSQQGASKYPLGYGNPPLNHISHFLERRLQF